jgi:hypothetical protein
VQHQNLSCEYYGFGGNDLLAFLNVFYPHSKSKVHMEGIIACYESLIDELGSWLKKPRAPSIHLLCLEMEAHCGPLGKITHKQ